MLQNDFDYIVKEFGVPVKLNNETATRKAIISNENVSDTIPNFDDKKIHCPFEIKRGDTITFDDVIYLVVSDVQSKRLFEYKAIIRPMTNLFTFTWETQKLIGYDDLGRPIYETITHTDDLPCIAFQEGNPTLKGNQIVQPQTQIKVIFPDNNITEQIEKNTTHTILNNTYNITDINLLQSGLRILTMEWATI